MTSFNPLRDRDAWSTIRGYVYQVDLTIQRWLDLEPHQILEIECGEDIDIVGRALLADLEERDRLLEQVKHREKSLTLRSPEAITAIACFLEHQQTNLKADIIFQFTTNAPIGQERRSPLGTKKPAIEAWEELRIGKEERKKHDELIIGILQILKNASKPDDLHKDTWEKFCDFTQVSTKEDFLKFIRKFQWRTNAPEAKSIKWNLQKQLLDRQYAIDNLQSQEQYQRLFLYVFNRLSERGRKQLTLEELDTQITLPTLNTNDHKTLKMLKIWSYEIDVRLSGLEQGQQKLSEEVKQLAKTNSVDSAFNYIVSTPDLDIYPLDTRHSLREETVQNLVEILLNHTWIAIDGSFGSGKTQLTVLFVQYLISQGDCKNCVWLRLRDLTVEQACLRFDQAIGTLLGHPFQVSFQKWYGQLCDHLDKKTILVFDDLPQLGRGDELESRLIQLARICHNKGIRLLSTSFYKLPQNLQSILGENILYTTQVPPFSNAEASDLFRAYGAPQNFLDSDLVGYLNGLANYHPSLLAAIAEYLHKENWQFNQQTFDELLRGDHTTGVNQETLNRILKAIQDDQSIDLLYRLNVNFGYFDSDDMQALANVSPSIERPRHRLNDLLGVWIQRDVNNRFMVSPLVKVLGSKNLPIHVYRACHLTLGERIVRNELNQYKAFNAICHFTIAEAFNKAGSLLIFVLNQLEDSETQIDDGWLLSLWSQQSLPEQMDLGIRLLVRSFQISFGVKLKKSVTYSLNDLDSLIKQVTIQEGGMVMALVANLISKCPEQIGFLRLNQYFQIALQFASEARLPDGSELNLSNEIPFESLIWAIAGTIQSTVDLEDWIVTLEQLTTEQREHAFANRLVEEGCLLVAKRLGMQEEKKPQTEQDWQSVLIATRKLVDASSNLDLELLWACAISSEIIILADYIKTLNKAIEVAENAINHSSNDPRVQFILKKHLGKLFVLANRHNEAIGRLTQAIEEPTESYPLLRLYTLLELSEVIATQEPYLSIQYAQQAVNLAQSFEEVPATDLVKALGELAIAKWLATDLSATFEVWEQGADLLLKCRRDTNLWKDLFVLFAHVTGYFTALATTGNPPNNIGDGESYTAPVRGIFLTRNLERVAYYNPSLDCFLPTQIASLAEAIGKDKRAHVWAMRGVEMAREAQQLLPLTSLIRNIIPHLVLENRYTEVLDLSIELGAILVALSKIDQSGKSILDSGIDIQAILDSSESETRRHAEIYSLILGVLPIIFHIADISVRQPELGKGQAIELAALCREISSASESHSLWSIAATIIDQIHLQRSTCAELISQYENLNSPDMILCILGLMAATLQNNATLFEVLGVHFLIIEQVQKLTNAQSTTWRKIILPYFFNYWKTSVEQLMFRFKEPQLAASKLYQSQELPINEQGQAILLIIGNNLIF